MATGFTKNFVVKNGLTTGSITLDAASGNIDGGNLALTGDLSVTGISDLGAIANIIITGGSNGQSIITDGNGNLSFANASAASSPAPMPIVIDAGNTLTISANYQGLFGYPLTIDGTLDVEGILIDVNDAGGSTTATSLDANLANVSISGGISGQVLSTDGSGGLTWVPATSPGGSNTQIQFNDAGSFNGNTGFTFDKTTGIFSSPYIAGNGNGLSNIQGANVSGAVSYATTANSVAGANVSGQVDYASVANSVTAANVTGLGNLALLNKDGNASNILYGNGVFAPVAGGGSYGNSDVATFLASYGSNTITTTGNVSVGNIIGNGQALTGLAGGNVTGQVANALVAGTVYTAAQPNITSIGTQTSLSATANITGGNLVTAGTGNVGTLFVGSGGANINGYTKITGNIDVTGNFNVTGNLNYQNVTDLVVGDPLIYLAANNVGDTDDIGIVGNYNDGTYAHTGVARDHTDGTWKFFSGVVAEPTTTIDWANAVYPSVKTGNLFSANITGTGWANITGNILAGNANLGNSVTANYFIGSGANLTSITGANVTGAVSYATTANSIALANVSGIGNISSINLDGNASTVLYGNGAFAAVAGSYGNSNVATFLASYGSNTITTTGNIQSGTLSVTGNVTLGNGTGGNITGANLISSNIFTTKTVLETATINPSAFANPTAYDTLSQSVWYSTANASTNFTLNIRGSSSTTMASTLATGQSITFTLLVTNGATPYYPSAYQVDSVSITPKYAGGTAISSGNANSVDVYVLTLIKTAATPTYTLLVTQSKFA